MKGKCYKCGKIESPIGHDEKNREICFRCGVLIPTLYD